MSHRTSNDAATLGLFRAAGVRFAHVVDDSILLERFRTRSRRGKVLRLHSPDDMFHAPAAPGPTVRRHAGTGDVASAYPRAATGSA